MKEVMVSGSSLPEAYHKALWCLCDLGEETDCADWNTRQKEISMTMVVENPLQEPMISRCFIGGPDELEQYRQEMLDGILDFEVDRGKWAYTYHDRMIHYPYMRSIGRYFDQIEFVIEELKRNPSSRRAVIDIRYNGDDLGSNEPSCMQNVNYFIRDGKLHCKVLFRSNDGVKATFMNAFAMIMLQKRIADRLKVEMGTYVHRANSFHCYAKDYGMLEGYCNRIKNDTNLTYDYSGDWEEQMNDAKPKIAKMVEELKAKV